MSEPRKPGFNSENFLMKALTRQHLHTTASMISRTVFRQSKALASCMRSASRQSLARPQFRSAIISFPSTSRQISQLRRYSTEPEAKKEGEAAAAAETNGKAEETEDPLKKELEAKSKEIIELKVCRPISPADSETEC